MKHPPPSDSDLGSTRGGQSDLGHPSGYAPGYRCFTEIDIDVDKFSNQHLINTCRICLQLALQKVLWINTDRRKCVCLSVQACMYRILSGCVCTCLRMHANPSGDASRSQQCNKDTTAHKNLFLLPSLLSPSLTPPLPCLIKIDETV